MRRFIHCGDTGFAEAVFRQIGSAFGARFDLALIPIGAYHPRWFLKYQHVDPAEAVKIHRLLGRPRLSLGMHWGTFILTDEPIDEPPQLLAAAMAAADASPTAAGSFSADRFVALQHGETVWTPAQPAAAAGSTRSGAAANAAPRCLRLDASGGEAGPH